MPTSVMHIAEARNTIYEATNIVWNSNDLLELSTNLNEFLDHIYPISYKKKLLLEFVGDTQSYPGLVALQTDQPYRLFFNSDAIKLYLKHMLAGNSTNKIIMRIKDIITDIDKMCTKPLAPRILPERIDIIMQHVNCRFNFQRRVFKNDQIHIGLLNNTCLEYNSFYLSNHHLDGSVSDAIMLTHPIPNFGCPQEHTFLHELGHALHTRLTHTTYGLPESFIEIQKELFPKSLTCPPKQAVEVFANCFSLAGSIGTDFECSNPLYPIRECDTELISEYFNRLFDSL